MEKIVLVVKDLAHWFEGSYSVDLRALSKLLELPSLESEMKGVNVKTIPAIGPTVWMGESAIDSAIQD